MYMQLSKSGKYPFCQVLQLWQTSFFLPVGTCGKPLTFVECHYLVLTEINSLNHVKPKSPLPKDFVFQSLNIFIVSMLGKAKSILASTEQSFLCCPCGHERDVSRVMGRWVLSQCEQFCPQSGMRGRMSTWSVVPVAASGLWSSHWRARGSTWWEGCTAEDVIVALRIQLIRSKKESQNSRKVTVYATVCFF